MGKECDVNPWQKETKPPADDLERNPDAIRYVVVLENRITFQVDCQPDTIAGQMVGEIGRFRDACPLLPGGRPYCEYPVQWVVDHLEKSGFRVIAARRFAIRYKQRFVDSQIDMCAPRPARLQEQALAGALHRQGEEIRQRALSMIEAEGGLRNGFDYVLVAEPA